MIIPIIYPSAAQFWLNYTHPGYSLESRNLTDLPEDYELIASQYEAREIAKLLGLSLPLHLVSKRKENQRHRASCVCRFRHDPFPKDSFYHFHLDSHIQNEGYEIYVACPELCFLQAARKLDMTDLIKFGFDMCAKYKYNEFASYAQDERAIFTTPGLIENYINTAGGFYGCRPAKKAVRFVLGNSNSPMETKLAILMVLPIRLGGYGMPKPQMNKKIDLTAAAGKKSSKSKNRFKNKNSDAVALLGYDYVHADIAWPKVVCEYNSNAAHLTPHKYTDDNNRRTALRSAGYEYIGITAGNLRSLRSIDSCMMNIRRALHLPDEAEKIKQYRKVRVEIAARLFEW